MSETRRSRALPAKDKARNRKRKRKARFLCPPPSGDIGDGARPKPGRVGIDDEQNRQHAGETDVRQVFFKESFSRVNIQVGVAGFPDIEIQRASGTGGSRFRVKIFVLGEAKNR